MKPLAEARAEVLKAMPGMATETIPVERCAGRVTAEPVVSAVLVPPFDNSAMDGFAVRAADVANVPTDLRIIEDVPAGSVPTMLALALRPS